MADTKAGTKWSVAKWSLLVAGVLLLGIVLGVFWPVGKDWVRWLECTIDDTQPATVPIILITIVAVVLGMLNSLGIKLFKSKATVTQSDASEECEERHRRELSDETKRKIKFDVGLAGVTLAAYVVVIAITESLQSLTGRVALILALLPGAVGLCHHVFAVGRHFARRQTTIEAYQKFRDRYDRARRGDTEAASPLDELAKDEPKDYTPPLPQTFFAALLITAVFLVPASMTKHSYFLWGPADAQYAQLETQPAEARCCTEGGKRVQPPKPSSTGMSAATAATIKAAGEAKSALESNAPGGAKKEETPKENPALNKVKQLIAIVNGVFFAGLGAYVWTMYLLVTRINTGALTSRFLMNSAVRSAMGLGIGVVVALAGKDMFGGDKVSGPLLLFVIGLLPQWALTTLRTKAKEWFGVKEDGCETLPLCLVDGLNDGLIDLLNELGVGDIEHLSNSDPGELTLQTLFPLSRVVDWIDQAVLIQLVRGDIVSFRKMGITCATDMMRLHGEFLGTIKLARPAVPPPATGQAVGQATAPAPAQASAEVTPPTENAQPPENVQPAPAATETSALTAAILQLASTLTPAAASTPAAPTYDPQAEARKVYAALASASGRSEEALHEIGQKLYDNYLVTFLWNLWNMPGSLWTGWVAEVAEWMPAIFDAATATATEVGITLTPEPSWDGRIGVISDGRPQDTLPESFANAFPRHLEEELKTVGFALRSDVCVVWQRVLEPARWWRDIVQPIFPLVQPLPKKRKKGGQA